MKPAKYLFRHCRKMKVIGCAGIGMAALTCTSAFAQETVDTSRTVKFDLVRSPGLASFPTVAPKAHGTVTVHSIGPVEIMKVKVEGLPPKTDFDLFVIQVPNAPFGLAWYQGDIETDEHGTGSGEFIGRFSIETFIVAPGIAPAPADPFTEPGSIPDATQNPQTNPVQTYHLGLWFDKPADVVKAGGPNTITPFNGEHDAGVQVLNTSEFPETSGPLEQVK
jgi:hypothetical protein